MPSCSSHQNYVGFRWCDVKKRIFLLNVSVFENIFCVIFFSDQRICVFCVVFFSRTFYFLKCKVFFDFVKWMALGYITFVHRWTDKNCILRWIHLCTTSLSVVLYLLIFKRYAQYLIDVTQTQELIWHMYVYLYWLFLA